MPTVRLRPRRALEDADAVARLIVEMGAYYSWLSPEHFAVVDEAGLAEWVAQDEDWLNESANLALVAEVNGEVTGYLEASILQPSPHARYDANLDMKEPRLFVWLVVVSELQKRHGIATELVEAAEAWARDQGVRLAICDTYLGSPQSLPFCERRIGYERRSVRLRKRL